MQNNQRCSLNRINEINRQANTKNNFFKKSLKYLKMFGNKNLSQEITIKFLAAFTSENKKFL